MRKVYSLLCMVAISSFFLSPAFSAETSTVQAKRFVEEVGQKIVTLIASPKLTPLQKEEQFRTILEKSFDLPSIGRFVLGRYWRMANTQEREEYINLFEDVVVKTYASQFDDYHNETLKVVGAFEGKDGGITVQSKVIRPSNQPLSVDWKVYNIKGEYRVLDIIVNGVSMSISQRSEYAALIRQQGGQIKSLLDAMRAQASGNKKALKRA